MDEQSELVITLPWPPSVNHYWRVAAGRFYITRNGIYYRAEVVKLTQAYRDFFGLDQSIRVEILAYPPDKRRRDLDNVLKSLLDALQHAGVYADDNQIDDLRITRASPNEGKVIVTLSAL